MRKGPDLQQERRTARRWGWCARIAASAVLLLAGYASLRFARADWLFRVNTLESLREAIHLAPGNSLYYSWLAERLEFEGQDSQAMLEAAARLNPRAAKVWTRLGLRAEIAGNRVAAERMLLQAAAVDHGFAPRWALMNFYLRQNDAGRFRIWARRALEMGYGDLTSVFDLCWKFTQDAGQIFQLVPDSPYVLTKYLTYLESKDRLALSIPVADSLLQHGTSKSCPALLDYCDAQLGHHDAAAAIGIWNGMCRRKWIDRAALEPDRCLSLSNGHLRGQFLEKGFDWRTLSDPEVTMLPMSSAGGLKVILSGQQPEQCRLLWQIVPVAPHREYRLHFSYRTDGMKQIGIGWQAAGQIQSALPPSEAWSEQAFSFPSGDAELVELALVYRRPSGQMRAEGAFLLRDLRLDCQP
jgi:hypothetical protein